MSIPDYQTILLPLLRTLSFEKETHIRSVIHALADHFDLSTEEREIMQPSGGARLFDNRVHWARKYLKEANLLLTPRRAHVQLSERGRKLLETNPEQLQLQDLREYPEFLEWENRTTDNNSRKKFHETKSSDSNQDTPEDQMEQAYSALRGILAQDLLEYVKSSTPDFFEQLILDLLLAMGYGGSRAESSHKTRRSGDEGIDGTIFEDRLGLDIIYLQAKRWNSNPVGRPEIQKFVGALHGQRAKKGIFITASHFTREATDYVSNIDPKVVLIDGNRLTQLMIDFNVGVSKTRSYEIKSIDSDYFEVE